MDAPLVSPFVSNGFCSSPASEINLKIFSRCHFAATFGSPVGCFDGYRRSDLGDSFVQSDLRFSYRNNFSLGTTSVEFYQLGWFGRCQLVSLASHPLLCH